MHIHIILASTRWETKIKMLRTANRGKLIEEQWYKEDYLHLYVKNFGAKEQFRERRDSITKQKKYIAKLNALFF